MQEGLWQVVTIKFSSAPGTGKSHRANELIGSAMSTMTQFHPEYSYGDFVGSYRPMVGTHLSEKAKDPNGQENSNACELL